MVGWTPGTWSKEEQQLMLHSGKKRRPFDCDRGQLARILAAFEAGNREEMTLDQIKEVANGEGRGAAPGLLAVAQGDGLPPPQGGAGGGDGALGGNSLERPHSARGASGFSRWSVCPGSIRLSLGLPSRDTDYSRGGTAAHWVLEQCLRLGSEAWEYAGQTAPNGVAVDDEMVDGVQLMLDTIHEDLAAHTGEDCTVLVEQQFSLEPLGHPDCFGTADVAILFPSLGLLRVYDFKYGAGIVVEVEGNGQVRYYAVGVLVDRPDLVGIEHVETVIAQPRCEHHDGYVRRERLTVDELNAWVETELNPAIERTRAPGAPLVEGLHCRFCPVKAAAACPLLDKLHNQLAEVAAQIKDPAAEAKAMEDWELAERLARVGPVEMFIRAMKDEARARLEGGSTIPGWKLVKKKANRVVRDGGEAAAREKWGDQAYSKPALLGIPALEKFEGGKEWANEWAFSPDTGVALAPDTDKRPAVKVRTAKEVFAGLITENA